MAGGLRRTEVRALGGGSGANRAASGPGGADDNEFLVKGRSND
jgi:hypothetical protein